MKVTAAPTNVTEPIIFIFYEKAVDIPLGLVFCFLGVLGVATNGIAIKTYWSIRKYLKSLPFLVCAVCLAHSDIIMLSCSILPYGALLLAGRAEPHIAICSIVGFIHNFCERFAWFIITSIMVYRCVAATFPIATRNMPQNLFTYILVNIGILVFCISGLPFLPLDMIVVRYDYIANLNECSYQFHPNATGMIILVDVVWWGPFIVCVASCIIFSVIMVLYSTRFKSLSAKKYEVVKKTVVLTLFFIVCYLPKAALSTLYVFLNYNILITWEGLEKKLGYKWFLYIQTTCFYLLPIVRASITPIMLKLNCYIKMCNTNKRFTPNRNSTAAVKICKNSESNGFKVKNLEGTHRNKSAEQLV